MPHLLTHDLRQKLKEIMKQHPSDRIINLDETNWQAVAAGFLTWAKSEANRSDVNSETTRKKA
jgi:hypothetical protein